MKIKLVLRVIGFICLVVSGTMILPLMLALYDSSNDLTAFILSLSAGIFISILMLVLSKGEITGLIGIREGVGITGYSWVMASLIGAMPLWVSGYCPSYTDAFFETMSGLTTTGATILNDIEALPRGLLLWRSLTHLMGGMGIIVLSLAVLPFLGVSGMEMYKAEVPGVTAGKVTPRLHQTAIMLWGVYIFLVVAETILLMAGGMTLFDAFCHSCSTIATGGFSTKNNSIAFFTSPFIQWVIVVFMFLSGVNFSLYFLIPAKQFREIFADEELKYYAGIVVVSAMLIFISLVASEEYTLSEYTLRQSFFHVVSIMTTTGFIVEDHDVWPQVAQFTVIILMVIGASGGSTGGGCKVSRFIITGRNLGAEIRKLLHPRAIIIPRMNRKPIPQSTIDTASAFLMLYLLMFAVATLITASFGIDIVSAFTGVITCLSNVGPGLNLLGATESFAFLPSAVKWLFSFCMLAGRLELFAVILLFFPSTYRK